MSYDSNGNILTLQRYGEREDATLPMLIDDLKYGYDEDDGSNKLLNVTDEETHPSGFNDGNKHTQTNLPDFVYDAAGNLIRDRNKKISVITYNHLNQPKKLTFDTGEITYLYDASGNKVQKKVTENRQTQITDYLGGFQYLSGKLDFLPHAEGYVKAVHTGSTTEYHYVYHYTDHLGNIRLSYGRDPETGEVAILKESHYYPFGLQHRGYVGDHRVFEQVPPIGRVNLIPVRNYLDDSYRYTFGGKEEQLELGLNWIDHHARNYDAALGRWMNVDPLGEEYSNWSPYNYVMNSPLRFIDPDGMQAILSNSSYINRYLNNEGLTLLQRSGFTPSIGSQGGGNGGGGSNNNDSMNRPIPIGDYSRGSSRGSATKEFQYLQLEINSKPIGNPGALEYISGGGIIKGVSLLRNAKVAGWVKGLVGGGKAAEKGKELFKFGGSAGRHMENPSRVVPVQILEQAIKGSKGVADPKGSRALMHTTEMFKNGKTYNLEVLYDKGTNTIWHFKYWSK